MRTKLVSNVVLTAAQAKASYRALGEMKNGKAVFEIPARSPLNFKSAFRHKGLCDGSTMSLDLTCRFSCSFCFVQSLLSRHPAVLRIQKETGLAFHEFAVTKEDPLPLLRRKLIGRDGERKFPDPNDNRVVFASPLMDIGANLFTAQQTIEACRMILEHTNWQIRLLSKSALLLSIAKGLVDYRSRVIYGLSTGTLDDRLAASFEVHTSSPTARLRTLHWLQDEGFRVFAMICPSLPQDDYLHFAGSIADAVRVDKCEHVWAEVFNVRGKSLTRTCAALESAGFTAEAHSLTAVSGVKNRESWETYARQTFLAHSSFVSPEKLRFMQYVRPETAGWWNERKRLGVVLLGKSASVVTEII